MSTTHGQPGLSSDQRSTIRSTILSTRHTLEDEIRRQLEKYGIYEAKKLPLDKLTHLSTDEIHTRRTLDAAIERELESTDGDLKRSITNYVREATKTYLNRFVALKTIEVRGLVEETITERPEYGNRSYMHHTVAEIAGELTNAPDDGYGAALDLAYQEIGAEIRMIFEDSEHTAIDLDVQVREEVLDELDSIADDAWESDEALGWVYQYFGEDEREEIDERVNNENYKIAGTDIATKTQLFTPRYIVEWMVDNSLGRTWLEMRGNATNIDDENNCFYLTPLENSLLDREEKPVEEITVLDPACGSGHMLFYAFDVLYQMYLEEGEVPEAYIPKQILKNNLYGIDIDSGAAQIAALSLYLKAKKRSPDVSIPQINIVSADAVLINGNQKDEILDRARSELEVEILEQIWQSFNNIREFGSLIRIEERIEEILEENRQELEKSGQAKFTREGSLQTQSSFVSGKGQEETWDQVKTRLLEEISDLASEAIERNNPIEEMFAGEVSKTVELLDILVHEYDVVVSNPPYLGNRKIGEEIKDHLKDNYLITKDIYGAFIQRCSELAGKDQYIAMVTPESFMFLYTFRKIRHDILENRQFVEGAHLSGHSFSNKDRPFTIPFVLRNSEPSSFHSSRFYRMTHEQEKYNNYEKKIHGLNEITAKNRAGKSHQDAYVVDQNSFNSINRSPFMYWVGDDILSMFVDFAPLNKFCHIKKGMDCADNDRFVRYWWEISDAMENEKWKWYPIGGSDAEYLDNINTLIDWGEDGNEVRIYEDSTIRNEDFFFEEGLLVRNFGDAATARYLPENCIFNTREHFLTTKDDVESIDDYFVIGYINSSFFRFVLNAVNPTLNTNVGDLKQIPLAITDKLDVEKISNLVEDAIQIRRAELDSEERNPSVSFEHIPRGSESDFSPWLASTLLEQDVYEAERELTHSKTDELVFEGYNLDIDLRSTIYENTETNLLKQPYIINLEGDEAIREATSIEYQFQSEIESVTIDEAELDALLSKTQSEDISIRDAAEKYHISPYTVAELRYNFDRYSEDRKKDIVGNLLSYYIGCLFGRWDDIESIDHQNEEILMFQGNLEANIMSGVRDCIEGTFGNPDSVISEIEAILGKGIEDWLCNTFFRYHHCKEYRRRGQRIPIYWQLESPEGVFSCFVYYQNIDENTLPKLRGQYLDPHVDELENELETLNAQTSGDNPDKELLNRKEEVQNNLDDLRNYRNTIDEMIDDGVSVDIEKGIWENIKEWDQYEVLETGLPKLKSSYSR